MYLYAKQPFLHYKTFELINFYSRVLQKRKYLDFENQSHKCVFLKGKNNVNILFLIRIRIFECIELIISQTNGHLVL